MIWTRKELKIPVCLSHTVYIVPQSAATLWVHTNFNLSQNYIGHGTFTFGDFGPAAKEVEIASG